MESFGKILKETREKKGIELETIAQETAISKEFLEALETESLDIMPGVTYATGFLTNYSDFLGCDTKYLLSLYHAKVLQETPTPVELLQIGKSPVRIAIWIIAGVLLLAGLAVGGYFLYKNIDAKKKEGITSVNMERIESRKYNLNYDSKSIRVYDGDSLVIPFNSGDVEVKIVSTNDALHLKTPIGEQIVFLGEDLDIDIDGNSVADINLFVADISKKDSNRGAEIRVFLKAEAAANIALKEEDSTLPVSSDAAANGKQVVLFQGNRSYPFTLKAGFNKYCLFRYQTDRKNITEKTFGNGDTLNNTSRDAVRIWMSDASAAKLQIQGDGQTVDLEIGKQGQVLVEDIRWIKDADGTYKLVVIEID